MENVRGQNHERIEKPETNQYTEKENIEELKQGHFSNQSTEYQSEQPVANSTTHTQRQEGIEGRNESNAII